MLRRGLLITATRRIAAPLLNAVWQWIERFGVIAPGDPRALRYRSLGTGSAIGFPTGAVFGERWIAIGEGTLVAPHVSMSVGFPIEEIDPDRPPVIAIGDRCSVGRGTFVVARCGVTIEDDVIIGPNVYITDHNHAYEDVSVSIREQMPNEAPVRIGAGSWLAANVVVLPGADIGEHVTVAAGSVVRGRIPSRSVVAGSPARVVRIHDGAAWHRDPPGHGSTNGHPSEPNGHGVGPGPILRPPLDPTAS